MKTSCDCYSVINKSDSDDYWHWFGSLVVCQGWTMEDAYNAFCVECLRLKKQGFGNTEIARRMLITVEQAHSCINVAYKLIKEGFGVSRHDDHEWPSSMSGRSKNVIKSAGFVTAGQVKRALLIGSFTLFDNVPNLGKKVFANICDSMDVVPFVSEEATIRANRAIHRSIKHLENNGYKIDEPCR